MTRLVRLGTSCCLRSGFILTPPSLLPCFDTNGDVDGLKSGETGIFVGVIIGLFDFFEKGCNCSSI